MKPETNQNTKMKYYAIISDSNDGPAFGIGTSESAAWDDAAEWGIDDSNRETCVCIEITETSYNAIKGGNPDAVEVIE